MASIQTSLYDYTHASKAFDYTHAAIPEMIIPRERVMKKDSKDSVSATASTASTEELFAAMTSIAVETSLYDYTHAAKAFDYTHAAIPETILREQVMKKDSKDSVSATASTASTDEVYERELERGDVPNSSVFGCW